MRQLQELRVTFIQRGMRTPWGFLGEGGGKTYRCGKEKTETRSGSGRSGMPSFRLRGQVRTMIKTEFFRQPSGKSLTSAVRDETFVSVPRETVRGHARVHTFPKQAAAAPLE